MSKQGLHSKGGKSTGNNSRRSAAVPNSLWLITALWGALLLGASVLWPMSYGYDEPQHIDMAYVYSAHPFHFYGPGDLKMTKANVGMSSGLPGYPPTLRFAVVPIPPRSQRPSFAKLGGTQIDQASGPNQMVQHPPLYYWMAAAVLRIPGVSGLAWDLQVWLMRLLSVVLMLPIPLLCWATARQLLSRRRPADETSPETNSRLAVLAAVIPLTVPNLIRDGSSVTNDVLLILTTSVLLYLLSRVLNGDLTRRTAFWVAVSLAAALLTKGLALVLPPVVLAAYLVGGWRKTDAASRLRTIAPPVAIAACGGIIGGLWWVRNVVLYGSVQTNGYGAGYQRVLYGPPNHKGTLGHFIPHFISGFVGRIWGGVGLADFPSPGPVVIYGWFFLALAGIAAALLIKDGAGSRLRGLVLFAAPVLIVLVVAEGSFGTFKQWSHELAGVQGRYLYSAIVVIAALAAVGWIRMTRPRFHFVLAPTVLVGALVTNAAVWILLLRTWYQPTYSTAGLGDAVHALLRWSPLPSAVTVLLVIVFPVVLGILTVVVTLRDARALRQPSANGTALIESTAPVSA